MGIFDYSKVKDPTNFKENCMAAHSDHVCYADMKEYKAKDTSFRYSLDGIWKFHYAKNQEQTIKGFEAADYNCRPWDDIRVPAHIQMEGYDVPQYTNVAYPWDGREDIEAGQIPEHFNPVASYAKYFELPENMVGQRVFISFQGAESGIAVWLNGKYVGYSEDSFTPSEFELTDYLVSGENKLAVQVFKWTSSSWCEDQDFFRFSGIYRTVYLYTVPTAHVYDMKVRTLLDDDYKDAKLEATLDTWGTGAAELVLMDGAKELARTEVAASGKTVATIDVTAPELWSAENPKLYELVVKVKDAAGKTVECTGTKVGFRRFEMIDHIMCLNGKRIVFKGVNRHEFSSRTGRVVSEEELMKDLLTMKQNNINAIRTCHYPDDSKLYGLCDELGLYLIAENNMESHGSWDPVIKHYPGCDNTTVVPGDNMNWMDMMLDRVTSCYERDKNHPAILIWSCGNESYGGTVIYEMSQKFRELDSDRLVHYEGVFNDRRYNGSSDMESQMYPSVESIKAFLAKDRSKPFICCEYTHAMGNSCGAMHKYTDLTDTDMSYQGGFIWDYIDQSIYTKDRYGKEYLGYGGDFDDRPTDYNFSGNGIAYGGERNPSPKMQEVKFNYQNIAVTVSETEFTVENKNLFTNTNAYDCVAELYLDGKKINSVSVETEVAPLEKASYKVPFDTFDKPGEYNCIVSFRLKEDTAWAERGHEVAFGQKVLKKVETVKKAAKKPMLIKGKLYTGVRGDEFEALFSENVGGLVSYRYAGKEMIKSVPRANFWRAPIDNDMGSMTQFKLAPWKIASDYITHRDPKTNGNIAPKVTEKDDCIEVAYQYSMPGMDGVSMKVVYSVYGDGTIQVHMIYDGIKGLPPMPEFGMMFKFDADYDRVEWYGNGPAETYADRKHGAKLMTYENKVEDNVAEYLMPQECGNKTEVRYGKVTDPKGRGMLFTADTMNFSALPYTPDEMECAMHVFELPEVHYTVVRVSADQMGIGGDDSWGAKIHEEYMLPSEGHKEFTFSFKGI